MTVYAVKTKSLKVLILGMYMSASVRVNLKVSLTQFPNSGEIYVNTSSTPESMTVIERSISSQR